MSKFHINKHGAPAPCKATKGKCPLGGDSGEEGHFDNVEDAQEHADKQNSEEFGTLPGVESKEPREPVNFYSLSEEDKVESLSMINDARDETFPGRENRLVEVDMSNYGVHVTTPGTMIFPEDARQMSDAANKAQDKYEFTPRRGERGAGFTITKK